MKLQKLWKIYDPLTVIYIGECIMIACPDVVLSITEYMLG